MIMTDWKLMEEIACAPGISSCEEEVAQIIKNAYNELNIPTSYDGLGSLVGYKDVENKALKIMIAAHMDEVGFMVKDITDEGFIHVQPIGSWWSHMVLGQWYTIITKDKKRYNALMGSMATHGLPMEARNKTVNIADVYLDLGVNDKQDVLNMGIAIDDMVVLGLDLSE